MEPKKQPLIGNGCVPHNIGVLYLTVTDTRLQAERLTNQGQIPGKGMRRFYSPLRPASYPVGTRTHSPGITQPRHEADYSMCGAIPRMQHVCTAWCLTDHRDNSVFTTLRECYTHMSISQHTFAKLKIRDNTQIKKLSLLM